MLLGDFVPQSTRGLLHSDCLVQTASCGTSVYALNLFCVAKTSFGRHHILMDHINNQHYIPFPFVRMRLYQNKDSKDQGCYSWALTPDLRWWWPCSLAVGCTKKYQQSVTSKTSKCHPSTRYKKPWSPW